MSIKKEKLWIVPAAMLLALAALSGCQRQQVDLDSELEIGSPFPTLSGTDLYGQSISLSEFEGKVVLLDFFGDW